MQPGSKCFVMTLSHKDGPGAHPFWYTQVLHAFHIEVLHVGLHAHCCSPQTMELLWVCWLGVEPRYHWGFCKARLPKVGFVLESDKNVFSFLDPLLVIRACHLIPSFSNGHTTRLMRQGTSVARHPTEEDDWCSFYVNMYAVFHIFTRIWMQAEDKYTALWIEICFIALLG